MATTIKSTALDFNSIKNNLKTFLQEKEEFTDYNFEASGLSNLLDVLAYNTHYNALIANFALNESFLSTAQLRSSVVSLSEGIGYIPKTQTSASATVTLSINTGNLAGRPATITLPAGTTFTSTVDSVVYTFQTKEAIVATDDGNGYYQFETQAGDDNIVIYEGTAKTKSFFVGTDAANTIYIIPDETMDSQSVVVKVYDTATSTTYTTYNNIIDATLIDANSTLYILKESPNGYFELSFGDGSILGRTPTAGNKIVVEYLSAVGEDANQAAIFKASNRVEVTDGNDYNLNVTTISNAAGGAGKETIESIRKNAPFQYASQNRMVTAADYSALVLRNFSSLIKDIKAWGGEDSLDPEFGVVYMSVVFNDNVTQAQIDSTKLQILDLASQLSVVSFDLKFDDPVETFIETGIFFQFNPRLTSVNLNVVRAEIDTIVDTYFANNTGKFERAFRRSNLLTLIDEVSPAVLSTRAEIKMQQRFVPLIDNLNSVSLRFPSPLAEPDDKNHIITSSPFKYQGRICNIRNRLNSSTLEVIVIADLSVAIDNVGTFNPTTGVVSIVGLRPEELIGGEDYIKITVTPANQSAVAPVRNDILKHDKVNSFITPVVVDASY
jgi:hypothetical protein